MQARNTNQTNPIENGGADEIVVLKNGKRISKREFVHKYHSLLQLLNLPKENTRAIALLELKKKLQNPQYVFQTSYAINTLSFLELIDAKQKLHPIVIDIIESAIQFEGSEIKLTDPRAGVYRDVVEEDASKDADTQNVNRYPIRNEPSFKNTKTEGHPYKKPEQFFASSATTSNPTATNPSQEHFDDEFEITLPPEKFINNKALKLKFYKQVENYVCFDMAINGIVFQGLNTHYECDYFKMERVDSKKITIACADWLKAKTNLANKQIKHKFEVIFGYTTFTFNFDRRYGYNCYYANYYLNDISQYTYRLNCACKMKKVFKCRSHEIYITQEDFESLKNKINSDPDIKFVLKDTMFLDIDNYQALVALKNKPSQRQFIIEDIEGSASAQEASRHSPGNRF